MLRKPPGGGSDSADVRPDVSFFGGEDCEEQGREQLRVGGEAALPRVRGRAGVRPVQREREPGGGRVRGAERVGGPLREQRLVNFGAHDAGADGGLPAGQGQEDFGAERVRQDVAEGHFRVHGRSDSDPGERGQREPRAGLQTQLLRPALLGGAEGGPAGAERPTSTVMLRAPR